MAPRCVLILGHSFVHHLHSSLIRNFHTEIAKSLGIVEDLLIKWHRIGGRIISKTRRYNLVVVKSFAPDVVILQLGTNDLFNISAVETGSGIEDLTRLLFESYGIQLICVCQTIYQRDAPSLNRQVRLLTQYLKVVLEPIPYVIYWRHRGFWNCKSHFLARAGLHLNSHGQYKFFRSLRGAVLRCLKGLSAC